MTTVQRPMPIFSGLREIIRRRRKTILWCIAALIVFGVLVKLYVPKDTAPEGAYMRVTTTISQGDPRTTFSYLEDRAQHAAYTIRDYRKKARDRIAESYPEPDRTRLMERYSAHADASDGADVWVEMATRLGWITRLRRDLSGIAKIEVVGERATVETVRGTRYALRRRENGMWGLTMFTAEMEAEAERAARDWEVVQQAALDYESVH